MKINVRRNARRNVRRGRANARRAAAARFVIACGLQAISLAFAGVSRADEPASPSTKADTTYGRIDGYVGLVFGAGATFGPRSPRATLDFRARYLETTGLFLTYEEGAVFGSGAEPKRVLAAGLELRPLFVARWLTGHEMGVPRADLILDSLGIELGGFLAQPQGGTFGDHPGLQAGLGLEVPVFARANGPWVGVHGGVRWSDAALGGDVITGPADRAMYFSFTIAWHQIVGDRSVDVSTAPSP